MEGSASRAHQICSSKRIHGNSWTNGWLWFPFCRSRRRHVGKTPPIKRVHHFGSPESMFSRPWASIENCIYFFIPRRMGVHLRISPNSSSRPWFYSSKCFFNCWDDLFDNVRKIPGTTRHHHIKCCPGGPNYKNEKMKIEEGTPEMAGGFCQLQLSM